MAKRVDEPALPAASYGNKGAIRRRRLVWMRSTGGRVFAVFLCVFVEENDVWFRTSSLEAQKYCGSRRNPVRRPSPLDSVVFRSPLLVFFMRNRF